MFSNPQSGVSLVITFFILIIVLAVVLSVSTLLYSEVRVIKNIGNSVVSLYAADSGIEKVLFYDNQILPESFTTQPCSESEPCASDQICDNNLCASTVKRGLCSMLDPDNSQYCNDAKDPLADSSIYCAPNNEISGHLPGEQSLSADHDGCDPSVCDDCTVSFSTNLDNGRIYYTTASVHPSQDGKYSIFDIASKGAFGGAARQIEVSNTIAQPESPIEIDACANPKSTAQGTIIYVCASVVSTIGSTIGSVTANIYYYNQSGSLVTVGSNLALTTASCSSNANDPNYCPCDQTIQPYHASWTTTSSTPAQAYYVDLDAKDNTSITNPNDQPAPNIPACNFQP